MTKVVGTLKYVTGFTGFSNSASEQEGNFLALNVTASEGATLTVSGLNKAKVQDNLVVVRITDKTKPIVITASKSGQSSTKELDLNGLTLTTKPTPVLTLSTLTVLAAKVANGKATLTLPNPGSGNKLCYKVTAAGAKPSVTYDMVCNTASGWTDIPEDKAVAGAAGQLVTIVEVTTSGDKARAKGEAVLA